MTAEARPDPLIHPITRLSICGLLAAGADWVEFAALRDAAGISDSVLSKQSRVLEEAGYVDVRKGAVGRRPRTWFRLTGEGRRAVQGHLAWLAQLEETVAAGAPDVRALRAERDQPRVVMPPLLGGATLSATVQNWRSH